MAVKGRKQTRYVMADSGHSLLQRLAGGGSAFAAIGRLFKLVPLRSLLSTDHSLQASQHIYQRIGVCDRPVPYSLRFSHQETCVNP